MSDYSQPEFYRFNEDSFKLIEWVKERVPRAEKILDLGAGSGVIGIELANVYHPSKLTLLEVQKDFQHHLEFNIKTQLTANTNSEVVMESFGTWFPKETYDLIVCNPPYFTKGQGRRSPDERKQTARTFMIDDWLILTKLIKRSISPKGHAFLVMRSDDALRFELQQSFSLTTEGPLWFLELPRLNVDRNQ